MHSLTTLARAVSIAALAGAALGAGAQTTNPATPSQQAPGMAPERQQGPDAASARSIIDSAFTRTDANKDGKLSMEESAKMPGLPAKFTELDMDNDGALTMDEFSAGVVVKKAQ